MTPSDGQPPALFLVRGDASPDEVAALAVVLTTLAASGTGAPPRPVSEWSAHHRKARATAALRLPSGRGGWRSSSLPR